MPRADRHRMLLRRITDDRKRDRMLDAVGVGIDHRNAAVVEADEQTPAGLGHRARREPGKVDVLPDHVTVGRR